MADLNPQEKAYYSYLWSIADSDKDGKMTAGDAVQFFRKANLPDQTLGVIWSFSDSPPKGFLTESEFYIALRLIAVAQSGKEVTSRDAGNNIGTLASFPVYPPQIAAAPHQPSSSDFQWVITPADRQKYTEYFKATDTDKDGFITGNEAFHLFSKSGLDMTDLAKIWKLSDITQDTKLDCEEFIIAMFLITAKRTKNITIPDTLPSTLLPGSSTSAPSSPAPPAHSPVVPHNKQISDEDKAKYIEIFKRSDPTNSKFVSGEQARQIFGRSGLNVNDLAKIWNLSDVDRDGKLNEPEFVIAMWLIYGKLKGVEIPDSISDTVKAEVGLVTAAPPTATTPNLPPKKMTGNYDISLDDLSAPAPAPEVPSPTPDPTPAPTANPSFGPDDGFGSFATFTAFNNSSVSLPTMSSGNTTPTHNLSTTSLPQYANTMSGNVPSGSNTPTHNLSTTSLPQYANTMSGNMPSGSNTPTHNLSSTNLPQYANTMSGNVQSGSNTPTHNLSTTSLPQYTNTMSGNASPYMSGNAYVNPAKKEEVTRQYMEERNANAELENQVNQEQRILDTLTAEFKELEVKLNEERTTSVALKEKLKYIRMQIKTIKEQKEQYERILQEKNEQYKEEEELYQLLASELEDKKNEVAKIQGNINSVTVETDALRAKKRDVKEELTAIKASPPPVHNTPAPASPVVAKKEPPPVPKKSPTTPPVAQQPPPSSFGFGTDDFSSSSFDTASSFGTPTFETPSSFGTPAFDTPAFDTAPTTTTPTPETAPTTTPATTSEPSFSATFDSFGSDFGSNSFDFSPQQQAPKVSPVVPPKPPAKKPVEEDPFAFTSDLSSTAINDAPDDFGNSAFGSSSSSSSFGTFGSHTGFGDSNFSFDSFGSTPANTTAPPPVPVKPAAVSGQPSFDNSSFDFPSNLAEFDTGKDSFG